MSNIIALDECLPGLSTELAQAVKIQHLSTRTSHTYQHWISQYLAYYDLQSPKLLTEKNVSDFLRHVTKSMSLSRARLNQARAALVFLYDKVLHKPLKQTSLVA
tara:strand:+ start:9485 stop:9796 length:312 start_codon:yes stop_codon:yes gene_type:complete